MPCPDMRLYVGDGRRYASDAARMSRKYATLSAVSSSARKKKQKHNAYRLQRRTGLSSHRPTQPQPADSCWRISVTYEHAMPQMLSPRRLLPPSFDLSESSVGVCLSEYNSVCCWPCYHQNLLAICLHARRTKATNTMAWRHGSGWAQGTGSLTFFLAVESSAAADGASASVVAVGRGVAAVDPGRDRSCDR